MERLMTTEDVAEYLRVDAVTVRRLITRGELTAYRIAGEYRFTQDDVENYVKSQRVVVGEASQKDPFERFTERARKVLTLAREEAVSYNHELIGTEHLLLGIVREGDGIAAKALIDLKVSPDKLRRLIEELHPAGDKPAKGGGEIALAPRAKKSISLAVEEARSLGHHYLGTEHMLLGLIRIEDGLAAQALSTLGVATLEQVRTQIITILKAVQKSSLPEPDEKDLAEEAVKLDKQTE